MLTKLESEIEEFKENFNKNLESITKNQVELKNTVTEMKNTIIDYLTQKNEPVT